MPRNEPAVDEDLADAGSADRGAGSGRTIGAALLVLGTAALVAGYAVNSHAVTTAGAVRSSDLLLVDPRAPVIGTTPSRATIERAVEADPLSQGFFNTAMAHLGRPNASTLPAPAWFATLHRYGWRNTPALQNLIYYHASRNEIGATLDVADALFRREKLMEQATRVFSLAETAPELRDSVVQRLRTRPAWRRPFLLAGNVLADPAAIEGRYRTLRTLQRIGDPLPDEQMTAILPVLVRVGRPADAFTLWSHGRAGIERPLNDPRFTQAVETIDGDDTATPFNWRFLSGDNFDVTTGGRGSSGIIIHWNGQGVPVFAMQQTSGQAGSYRMRVFFNPEDAAAMKAIGFRMICGDVRIDLMPVAAPKATYSDWRTPTPVRCAFPRLEVFGAVTDRRQDVTVTLTGIALQRE